MLSSYLLRFCLLLLWLSSLYETFLAIYPCYFFHSIFRNHYHWLHLPFLFKNIMFLFFSLFSLLAVDHLSRMLEIKYFSVLKSSTEGTKMKIKKTVIIPADFIVQDYAKSIQAHLWGTVGLVPGHHSKGNITIKWVK